MYIRLTEKAVLRGWNDMPRTIVERQKVPKQDTDDGIRLRWRMPLSKALTDSFASQIMTEKLEKYLERNEKCKTCPKFPICIGGCRANGLVKGAIISVLMNLTAIFKRMIVVSFFSKQL